MAAVHKLKPEPPTISPLRVALADRIEAARSANARSAAVASAHQTADAAVHRARRALETAASALEKSKADAGTFLADVALGTAGERPTTIRDARNALQDAEDELTSALAARDALNAQMAQGEGSPELNRALLKDAAIAVLTSEAATTANALVAEVHALQRQLAERGAALAWLANETGIFARGTFGGIVDPQAATAMARLSSPPTAWMGLSGEQHAGRDKWETALARLMSDAGAQL